MKIRTLLAATALIATAQAYGHGFDLEGGEGSTAQLFTEALVAQCEGSCVHVQNEDDFGYLECTKVVNESSTYYQCFAAEKHGRALGAKEDYRRGDYMNFEGRANSNATYLFTQLSLMAELNADERITLREINENRRVIEWKTQSETFRCTQDTSSGEPNTECRIQR